MTIGNKLESNECRDERVTMTTTKKEGQDFEHANLTIKNSKSRV